MFLLYFDDSDSEITSRQLNFCRRSCYVAIVLSSGLKHGACSSADVVVMWPLFCRQVLSMVLVLL
jgi:hypothetical protein